MYKIDNNLVVTFLSIVSDKNGYHDYSYCNKTVIYVYQHKSEEKIIIIINTKQNQVFKTHQK